MGRKKSGVEFRSVGFRMPIAHFEVLDAYAEALGIDLSAVLNGMVADALATMRRFLETSITEVSETRVLTFTYTNWQCVTARRRVRPMRVRFGASEFHEGEHWMLEAHDLDRHSIRSFLLEKMTDISEEQQT